ncbi:MAG: hypothetical protein MZW92_81525 [Comamonadaceae bacterium]|nr:hypothetical protein [Comamonadaceae bacterium]
MTGLDFFLAGWALAALLMLVAWIVQWRTRRRRRGGLHLGGRAWAHWRWATPCWPTAIRCDGHCWR